MESFLKEQLKRIQDLGEQMTSLQRAATEMLGGRMRETAMAHESAGEPSKPRSTPHDARRRKRRR